MPRIILKRIDVNNSCFDICEVNLKYVVLGILEGAYKNLLLALTLFCYFALGQ